MIGIVVVSHSPRLAEGVCELAAQVAQGNVRLAAAAGTGDPANPIGTDAYRVLDAIESVYTSDGVLVLMDLGSAVLSAETAIDLLDADKRPHVRLCAAPLVEGAVAAATLAAAGAPFPEIAAEAERALSAKSAHLAGPETAPPPGTSHTALSTLVAIPNRLGLHARPAAQFVRLARAFHSALTLENVTMHSGPVGAGSISGLLGLGIRQGHELRIRAEGEDAPQAIAALRAFIQSGCGEDGEAPEPLQAEPQSHPPAAGEIHGAPASAGIAIGPLARIHFAPVSVDSAHAGDSDQEWRRLLAAIAAAREETQSLLDWTKTRIGPNGASLFNAQLLMLDDPALLDRAREMVLHQRASAGAAWQAASREFEVRLAALDDPYLRARTADIEDTATRVLRRLSGASVSPLPIGEPSILTSHELVPSMVKQLDPARVLGLCLESGSASAHSVILARARGIPIVTGLGSAISAVPEGTTVALDGERGLVWISPGEAQVHALESRREDWIERRRVAEAQRLDPASTRDGHRIRVFANINRVADAAAAVEYGADGVGVLRTEFLFLDRAAAPDEEQQFAAYREIAGLLAPRPLVIRTLDAGGDKSVPYLDLGGENNPFLGWRGIRVTLCRRDLFRTQLRAILRAGAGSNVELLLPMISTLDEFRDARGILRETEAELQREGAACLNSPKLGVMIEVPAAVAIADQLANEADFFSIGTNDLVQYVMAADRTNARVAQMADPFQPAVLRMIRQAVHAARNARISAALCGEMAADPLATPLLLGLGIEEFSVSPPLIPELKQAIARWSLSEAEAIAHQALGLDSSAAVRDFLAGLAGRNR